MSALVDTGAVNLRMPEHVKVQLRLSEIENEKPLQQMGINILSRMLPEDRTLIE